MEEAMEILSLIQLKQTTKPLILVNVKDFYRELMELFKKMIRLKFVKPDIFGLFKLVKDPAEAIKTLKNLRRQ